MATLLMSEHRMTTWDGAALFYRAWHPLVPTDRALLLFHRGHEHSGRLEDVVHALGLDDLAVFAWDARGHGHSAGERGDAPSFGCLVRDVEAFVRFVAREHKIPVENMVVMAHSVGAVVAAAWVHDYAPPIRGMILASPAFRVKLYVPFAVPLLRLLARVRPRAFVQSYVKARLLTHDRHQQARYDADPLVTRAVSVNVLLGLHDTSSRLMRDAAAIRVPTLVLTAGSDYVVRSEPQERFVEALGTDTKAHGVYPDLYHDLLHEVGRESPLASARWFIYRVFAESAARGSRVGADRAGAGAIEYARLSAPLPVTGPRRWAFAGLRLAMRTLGRLSQGVRIGWRTGFDSGASLDYVYENTARGFTPLGRLIDRAYLDGAGWRAIRRRRANLESLLRQTVLTLHAAGQPVRVVDVAAGPGRYVLETMRALPHVPMTALLRDADPDNLETGRALARSLGLSAVHYARGDAFDRASLSTIEPRPTVAIVSGLYELVPDNARILASLQGLRDALGEGGYLLYTNQPWHPQLELIARTLTNREGRPWIMRCRAQAEMDELVRLAGFEKLAMEIDDDGIFSVSVARVLEER